MEDVLVKCPKCKADVISGQIYCANCEAKQELKMRTKEEIQEMIKRIDEILSPKKLDPTDKGAMGNMMMLMVLHMVSESCFQWVLGLKDDQKLLDMLSTGLKKKL